MKVRATTLLVSTALFACRMDNPAFGLEEGSGESQASNTTAIDDASADGKTDTLDTGDGDGDGYEVGPLDTGDGDGDSGPMETGPLDTGDGDGDSGPMETGPLDTGDGDGDTGPLTDTSVGDGDGDTGTSETGDPLTVFLFGTASDYQGSLGPLGQIRSAANGFCQTELLQQGWDLGCTEYAAMISISGEDTIALLPDTHGLPAASKVFGPYGENVADSWEQLLNEDLLTTLADAGVMYPGEFFWSGATTTGGWTGTNCGGFSNADAAGSSIVGTSSTVSATGWLTAATQSCSEHAKLLCACW